MIERFIAAMVAIVALATPALAADFDFDITDVKGFRHWDHTHGSKHTMPRAHHTQVAQHARKHPNPANEALFKAFLVSQPSVALSPLPQPPPPPKGTAPPPPAWAGTIEDAIKRWPHGE